MMERHILEVFIVFFRYVFRFVGMYAYSGVDLRVFVSQRNGGFGSAAVDGRTHNVFHTVVEALLQHLRPIIVEGLVVYMRMCIKAAHFISPGFLPARIRCS